METPQKQTAETTSKSWDQLVAEGENPINLIGTPLLDETTVPDDKRGIYETIVAAEYSAIEAEAETAAARENATAQANRDKFFQERAKARKDISDIAVRGSIAAAINDQPVQREAVAAVGTYQTGYLPKNEVDELLEARRNGDFS